MIALLNEEEASAAKQLKQVESELHQAESDAMNTLLNTIDALKATEAERLKRCTTNPVTESRERFIHSITAAMNKCREVEGVKDAPSQIVRLSNELKELEKDVAVKEEEYRALNRGVPVVLFPHSVAVHQFIQSQADCKLFVQLPANRRLKLEQWMREAGVNVSATQHIAYR